MELPGKEKKDPNASFYREGQAKVWKQTLDKEQIAEFNLWTKEKIRGTDFPYEF